MNERVIANERREETESVLARKRGEGGERVIRK